MPLLHNLSLWMLLQCLRRERRMMIKGHSWWIEITGLPWPEFWFEECSGSWRLDAGWFTFYCLKPRSQWTPAMREGNPSRQTRLAG